MTTNRLEAFSDGVFAIAATLLILNVVEPGGPLGQGLLRIWASYVAYAVSFVTIGVIWINHHGVMAQIAKVDRLFLLVNVRSRLACSPSTSWRKARRRPHWPTGSR